MATFLSTTLQPQLAPLFAAQLPPKAAKAALAKRAAAAAAAGAAGGTEAGGPQPDASAVLVVLPGVVGKLPENVGYLAADVLYHTGACRVCGAVRHAAPRRCFQPALRSCWELVSG